MGDRVQRTQAARDFAKENNTSIHEAECQIDIRLFLDKYPRWELGTPITELLSCMKCSYMPLIGVQKEAEQMVCTGATVAVCMTHGSEADQSAMELVGYHTSWSEMTGMFIRASIYCRRVPGLPPCGAQPRRKAMQRHTILLWRANYIDVDMSSTVRNLESQDEEVELNQCGSYDEALRVAHQRTLDTSLRLLQVTMKG